MKGLLVNIVCICFSALLSGCANDQYILEKHYWYVQRLAQKIFKNPHASPPAELESVISKINKFIDKYHKTNLAVDAQFTIAHLYMVKEEFDKARQHLNIIIEKYSNLDSIQTEAIFLYGRTYELQDKWNLALEQYKKILKEYPKTLRGLSISFYIANYYKNKYQPEKMINTYHEAINHFKNLADQYPNAPVAFAAHYRIAQCYIALKDWQAAIDTFNTLLKNYRGKINLDKILMNVALIYKNELKDKNQAKKNLEQLIKEYPKSRLIEVAKTLLKDWGEK